LGLAIVHQLVLAMDGTIECDSALGRGTTFTVELPLIEATESAPVRWGSKASSGDMAIVSARPPHAAIENQGRGPLRVLLAEDNPVNQKLALALLRRCDCEVDAVGDGLAAFEAFARTPYDLVFMDMQMPILDGLEACRKIRASEKDGRRVPIVALTANAFQEDQDACREAGMDGFLSKPVNSAELKRVLDQFRTPTNVEPNVVEPNVVEPNVA
jgi:CheY-like chemotaxis protein